MLKAERHTDQKGRNKTLFIDDVIACIENIIEYTKKICQNSAFNRTVGCMLDVQ